MSNTKEFGKSGAWKGWVELCGDVNWEDYGGKWGRQDPNNPSHFYVIRHDNMIDAMGEREVEESGIDQHISTVYLVDLSVATEDQIESAMECCGLDFDDWMTPPTDDQRNWAVVECLVDYGAAAPMGEHSHPHRADVARASARREVEELIGDADKREELLDRPVNKLGSTAREYAAGDLDSALARGVHAGDPSARLVAKMHGVAQEVIDDARPADFLPYVMGYMAAMSGGERETGEDLAPEYGQGFERGERVRKGEAPAPGWIRQG